MPGLISILVEQQKREEERRRKKKMFYIALSTRVLAVAVVNTDANEWAAYIDSVNGHKHDEEYRVVPATGTRLDERIAALIFPSLAVKYDWRF